MAYLALQAPLMDSGKARREPGWTPAHSSTDALRELLEGLWRGKGADTPPLDADAGGPARVGEVKSGMGKRQ